MRLDALLVHLERAGLANDTAGLLDALWLATRGRVLTLHNAATEKPAKPALPPASAGVLPPARSETGVQAIELPESERLERPDAASEAEPCGVPPTDTVLYPPGMPDDGGRPGSLAAIPAAHTLSERLPLTWALRPFRQAWPSRRDVELDEARTAAQTAELRQILPHALALALRPRPERWFQVDLVMEDAETAGVWAGPLRDFAALLRDSGAFRSVRRWRLRLNRAPTGSAPRPMLEAPGGALVPTARLAGDRRRLILFASHGLSGHWRNGHYAKLLTGWSRGTCVALLHLLPPPRWDDTTLGDGHGVCSAPHPGALGVELRPEPAWWSMAPNLDRPGGIALPVLAMEPAMVASWARMQMGQSHRAPMFLLHSPGTEAGTDGMAVAENAADPDGGTMTPAMVQRAVTNLRGWSPAGFRLAVLLSDVPFTLPVARLVLEAADVRDGRGPEALGHLLLSGLLRARSVAGGAPDPDRVWYEIRPEAWALLRRSRRTDTVASVAHGLEAQVRTHLEQARGRAIDTRAFVPDTAGRFDLPDWAQPFAHVSRSLLRREPPSPIPPAPAPVERRNSMDAVVIIQRADGDGLTLTCGGVALHLQAKHARTRAPRSDLDLLRPESRLLDLVGREVEMARLDAWLDDQRPVLVRGITGHAGSGKTRLAIELCSRAAAAGWRAGFLGGGDLDAFVKAQGTAVWPAAERMLIVVDYAARRAGGLNAWLHSLAQRDGAHRPRLRLLLLERHASPSEGWWADLTRPEGSDSLHDGFDLLEPVPLRPLAEVEQRRDLLAGVMAAWCRRNGTPVLTPPAASADPQFDRWLADPGLTAEPLFLMMAGLVAVRDGMETLLSLGRLDLAFRLASQERDHLARLAREHAVSVPLLLHLVACITLCQGVERDALRTLIDEECAALPQESGTGRDRLAELLEAVLPAQAVAGRANGLGGIEPDIIGESFCLLVLAAGRDLDEEALIDRCRERAPVRTAQTLIRIIQDFTRPAAELANDGTPVARRPEGRLPAGLLGEANPALGWLDRLLAGTVEPGILMAISNQMPRHRRILRERLVVIHQRITEMLRLALGVAEGGALESTPGAARPAALRSNLAASLNTLAGRLSDLGQYEKALDAAGEAVALYRDLAAEKLNAFQSDLATALNNLANIMNALRQREQALDAATEAVALYRDLAARGPDAFQSSLAGSLNTLAKVLRALHRREDALDAAEQAVALYRDLAAARPTAFQPDLATAFNNLAGLYRDQGRLDEAAPLLARALSIRETALGPDHPDTARSLSNLAGLYRDQGRLDEAAPLLARALSIRETALGPDHPDTARSLSNLAALYRDQGRLDEAAPLLARALSIQETALGPDHPDTARSLNNLAALSRDQGRLDEAAQLLARALSIRETALGPDHPDTARSLNNLAALSRDQGRLDEAAPLLARALSIRETALGPDHLDTARSLSNLAGLYRDQGRLDEAAQLLARALSIRETALGPDHPDTARSLNNLAGLYRDQGRLDEAALLLARALAIRETALGPDHPDTARSLNNLAGLYRDQGRLDEAAPLLARAQAIRKAMLGLDHPDTTSSLDTQEQ
ncbi:tetratricopeptide repeat protein [Azospirillum thiophilum]|nr:tetratricopeptide repeat protein [Azospirillum thiophilum]